MSILASVWSFISTLVRSLLAFFSFRRRRASVDPFSLPSAHRTPSAALHTRLRPILLTPRSISLARTRSVASTLHTVSATTSQPERTSPKLDPHDAELGLRVTPNGGPAAGTTSLRECTPDTSATGSLSVLPLTPPDRCYLAPLPSTTDCPYTEPWPIDRAKSRLSGSPLKVATNADPAFTEPMVAPIGSPPPGRWSPVEIWTSTPCKSDVHDALDLAIASFDPYKDASALVNISHAIITRSQSSIRPYDDNSSAFSGTSPSVNADSPTHERYRTLARVPQSKHQLYPRFHHPDAYAWRRYGARLPGKADRANGYSRSHSHMDLTSNEWYPADAYAQSPVVCLSPPLGDSATEDEDEVPLCHLRERLINRSAAVGATLGLGLPVGAGTRKPAALSPRTRRMSEGCLLALSETTPTRVGVNPQSGRRVLSMARDGGEYGANLKDWLAALSLQCPSEQMDALEPDASAGAMAV